MSRREEFVVRLLESGVGANWQEGDGVVTGLGNAHINIDYYDRKKAISDLPREIYNPLRYLVGIAQQAGHVYFKPNSKFSPQEYKEYYCAFIGNLLLLF